jgi:diguanylate cyclase (GGDEF)-like protein
LNCSHFTGSPPEAYTCVPLAAQGEVIGILHVQFGPYRGGAAACSDAEMNVIKATAQHLALALANLGLREKLFERATRDNLTGLYNRHYMREWFEQELLRAGRHRRSIGMIMVDVDHFKRVNDTFGHDAGDLLLCELAAVIRRIARSSDVACRHGGEEFLLLMPDATLAGTRYKAEKLRRAVAEMAVEYGEHPLRVTVSAGVAVYPDHGADVNALLRAADEALYAAKGAGRDCVMVYEARLPATATAIARVTRNRAGAPPATQHNENCNAPGNKAA